MPIAFQTVRKVALSLENTEEGTSYGTAAFKVRGAVQTKAEYIRSLTSRQWKLFTYQMDGGKVVFFRGGAVVSGPTEISLVVPGLPISTVWVEKPSGWQVVLNQGTSIAPPPAAAAQ